MTSEEQKLGRLVEFSALEEEERNLVKSSVEAREFAYCPYSQFPVGAAVRVVAGGLFLGCNVENFSFPVTTCAERVAITKAVSEGNTKLEAVAVSGLFQTKNKFVFPCGMCLQAISEFAMDEAIHVYLVKPDLQQVLICSLKELLPQGKF